jgi:hypothetical protein
MGSGGIAPPFLTSALDGGEWSASRPCRFNSGEEALVNHWIGGWVGPRAGLDAVEKRKILHCRKSNPGPPACSLSLYRRRYPDNEPLQPHVHNMHSQRGLRSFTSNVQKTLRINAPITHVLH